MVASCQEINSGHHRARKIRQPTRSEPFGMKALGGSTTRKTTGYDDQLSVGSVRLNVPSSEKSFGETADPYLQMES